MLRLKTPRIYIAAIKKSSGKTTIAISLGRILKDTGLNVQMYKKGPDFIDPMWHTQASGRQSRNLDFFLMGKDLIKEHFISTSTDADISIIEGNHGLFDDINVKGGSDNASLAKLLNVPVVLVLDVKELGRTVAAIIKGCMEFDKDLNIVGVILNRIHNKRQEKRLKEIIKLYTGLPVLGCIPEMRHVSILQRHLGLTSTLNGTKREKIVRNLAEAIKPYLDIDGLIKSAKMAKDLCISDRKLVNNKNCEKLDLVLGLAYDEAFNFYYPENVEILQKYCNMVEFSPLRDERLPEVDALYIGGGFPEIFADELEKNVSLREDIRDFFEKGGYVYAECGGLVYLTERLTFKGKTYSMVSAIEGSVEFENKPVGHGYTILKPTDNLLWVDKEIDIRGHEFHHARLICENENYAFEVLRGFGINGKYDGIVKKNTVATFTHQYAPSSALLSRWLDFINLDKRRRKI